MPPESSYAENGIEFDKENLFYTRAVLGDDVNMYCPNDCTSFTFTNIDAPNPSNVPDEAETSVGRIDNTKVNEYLHYSGTDPRVNNTQLLDSTGTPLPNTSRHSWIVDSGSLCFWLRGGDRRPVARGNLGGRSGSVVVPLHGEDSTIGLINTLEIRRLFPWFSITLKTESLGLA